MRARKKILKLAVTLTFSLVPRALSLFEGKSTLDTAAGSSPTFSSPGIFAHPAGPWHEKLFPFPRPRRVSENTWGREC